METMIEESPVIRKTRELCQTILDQPSIQSIRQRIDAFMGDEKTRAQYDTLEKKLAGATDKDKAKADVEKLAGSLQAPIQATGFAIR